MNYTRWLAVFIFINLMLVIFGRFLVDDVSYFKMCACQIVLLLSIIATDLLRRKK